MFDNFLAHCSYTEIHLWPVATFRVPERLLAFLQDKPLDSTCIPHLPSMYKGLGSIPSAKINKLVNLKVPISSCMYFYLDNFLVSFSGIYQAPVWTWGCLQVYWDLMRHIHSSSPTGSILPLFQIQGCGTAVFLCFISVSFFHIGNLDFQNTEDERIIIYHKLYYLFEHTQNSSIVVILIFLPQVYNYWQSL